MTDTSTVPGLRERARLSYTHHLADLIGRVEAEAARLRVAGDRALADAAAATRTESARTSVRLDGSPLEDATAAAVEAGHHPAVHDPALHDPQTAAEGSGPDPAAPAAPAEAAGGWAQALRLEGLPTQDVAALEHAGVLAVHAAEDRLAGELFADPRGTLAQAHRLLTRGLVDPEVAGTPRRTDQAVHDGAQGQLLYPLPEPALVPALLEDLCAWLGRDSATVPTPVVAGLVHQALLEWQPFEAAGGRLARAAARLVLRARGLDPVGAIPLDRRAAADPARYHREVAATRRRRGDVVPWLEWWLEGVAATAGALADRAHQVTVTAPATVASVLRRRRDEAITITEYASEVGCDRERARADLRVAETAGLVRTVPGSRRLRFVLDAPDEPSRPFERG